MRTGYKAYVTPYDYISGIAYCLTSEKINKEYTVSPSTFYVEELVDWEKLGLDNKKGEYIVYVVEKAGIDTFKALNIFSKKIALPEENIVFLGLKDRDARAKQYFFVKKTIIDEPQKAEIELDKLRVYFKGYVRRKPSKEQLIGNRFTLRIKAINSSEYGKAQTIMNKIAEHGLPSYYGYQRFGLKRSNTHLLGKYLLLERLDLFMEELLKGIYPYETSRSIINRILGKYDNLYYENIIVKTTNLRRAVDRITSYTRNLFIDAYSTFLYNLALNKIIDLEGWKGLYKQIPLPGCREGLELYREIISIENLPSTVLSTLRCWKRNGVFKPEDIEISLRGEELVISFKLRRGLYATVVMRELFKENLRYPTQTLS